jgi:superfamily II DNA/RNA helicase
MLMSFSDMNLPAQLLLAIAKLGYDSPSPFHQFVSPPFMAGRDLIGRGDNGSGKTSAFVIETLAKLEKNGTHIRATQCLFLVEHHNDVFFANKLFSEIGGPRFTILALGKSHDAVNDTLALPESPPQIVIGTPSCVNDMIDRGSLLLDSISLIVLDRADSLLNDYSSCACPISNIFNRLPQPVQTCIDVYKFPESYLPEKVLDFKNKYMRNPFDYNDKYRQSLLLCTTIMLSLRKRLDGNLGDAHEGETLSTTASFLRRISDHEAGLIRHILSYIPVEKEPLPAERDVRVLSLEGVRQFYVDCGYHADGKVNTLCDLLGGMGTKLDKAVIYCNSARVVEYLNEKLQGDESLPVRCFAAHSDMNHTERDPIMKEFHECSSSCILITVDMGSRGAAYGSDHFQERRTKNEEHHPAILQFRHPQILGSIHATCRW